MWKILKMRRCLDLEKLVFIMEHFFIRPSSDGTYYGMVMSVRVSVQVSVRLSVRPSDSLSVRPFSALFSYMLWHIELKFCTWLRFDVLQIKFDCRHFASIFEGVMPLCELRIKVMCNFLHFSPTCFDILSSNFAYDFHICFTVLQIKFECRQFALMFVGVMSLLELRILKIHSFLHFSLLCFDILSSNFAYDFVSPYYTSSSSVVNFC